MIHLKGQKKVASRELALTGGLTVSRVRVKEVRY